MQQIKISSKVIKTERPAFVMGNVNATPDSFYDKSRGGLERAFSLIEEGADIIDIGGESTRLGFIPVSAEEEIKRIIPLVKEIKKNSDAVISVDTQKFQVFKAAFEEGAEIWNDVSFLPDSMADRDKALDFIAKNNFTYILMHNGQGDIKKVCSEIDEKLQLMKEYSISPEKIILDPGIGIGFGKSNEESINIIKNTNLLCQKNFPVLMALSRKSCIGQMTGREVGERLSGTLAANMLSVEKGAVIVRVHDVSETIDALNVMKYLQ